MSKQSVLIETLRQLLQTKSIGTQEALVVELKSLGFEVNQSKLSRILHKIGAIKLVNQRGELVYHLAPPQAPLPKDSSLSHLALSIHANESCILIKTLPGSASLIGHMLDQETHLNILGTLAGDDVVMIIPTSVQHIPDLQQSIQRLLFNT